MGIGLAGLALDQLAKLAALAKLTPGVPVDILGGWLRLTLIRNPGAAFGLGSGSTLVLSIFAIIALLAAIGFGLPRITRLSHSLILGLLMAGIAGNLHDRLLREPAPLYGHVIDFIQLPYFAIFNVADMFITSAAVLVVVSALRRQPDGEDRAGQAR